VGGTCFDMKRQCVCGAENLILYENGEAVIITTQERPVRFLLVSDNPSMNRLRGMAPLS